ncbi:hypothetical protein GCG21_09025 [Pseudactinotalea sp. HY160]|uniref:hypothetical protein n=1 Tax=Pseudactinotalea sp. HY160 TaxID=2654490 RepID=UPI00128CCE14|nr:hypothetical protein [Pseudactinotalea sp. HY160]MPV50145.1 hypothetical protein [Pseudactinotalea sp. HY160]
MSTVTRSSATLTGAVCMPASPSALSPVAVLVATTTMGVLVAVVFSQMAAAEWVSASSPTMTGNVWPVWNASRMLLAASRKSVPVTTL